MKLKTETKTVHFVDYCDLDEFIKACLPQYLEGKDKMLREIDAYEVVAYEEWNNDESHEFEVSPSSEEFEREDSLMWGLPGILDFLCSKGHLAPGSYVISVFW